MFRASFLLSALFLAACGPQDGIVGSAGSSAGGPSDAGPAATPSYRSELDTSDGWRPRLTAKGSSAELGVPALGATGAELRFPADSKQTGASSVAEIESPRSFGFGTFRTRLAVGSCRKGEDVVNAAFGYLNDGTDANGNGLTDDEEINIQVLCGSPTQLYLTVFTDYEIDATGERFRKRSRVIDFATGDVFDTQSPETEDFVQSDSVPGWVRPELFAPGAYQIVGFEWHAASLSFFIELDGARETLWTLDDSARIPQRPVTFLYNLWHPDVHWYPASGSAAAPAEDVVMHVDWFEYYAE